MIFMSASDQAGQACMENSVTSHPHSRKIQRTEPAPMPELPEVETMVRGLRPALEGVLIARVEVLDASMVRGCGDEELEELLAGSVVQTVARRGKWVVVDLGAERGLVVIQPRMSGGFWLVTPTRVDHARLVLHLDNKNSGTPTIWYCDTRRLGRITWYPSLKSAEADFTKSQGPDALEITAAALFLALKRTSRAIKPSLMDQKIVAGIGNIYADEILFRARIHPERTAGKLREDDLVRLHHAIGEVLGEAIAAEGASFDSAYRTVLGLEGGFLAQNAMYGRGGKPCNVCGGKVVKTKISGLIGRPTYLCPTCQPKNGKRVSKLVLPSK
jgi:formamidopyrimidine-DNA glycosylase